MRFLITDIGKEDVLLRYPWLSAFEPKFSWTHGTINEKALPVVIKSKRPEFSKEVLAHLLSETDKHNIIATLEQQCTIRSMATDLAIATGPVKEVAIPKEYEKFAKVFSKEESHKFPPKRKWDHAIEFKKGTPDQINCGIYNLSQMESQQLYEFLLEQLDKGYIRPSKSQYASPFFFVKKKDRKLHPVQDYQAINKYTIHDNYPLPLIQTLICDLSGAHLYTKLDIRWGYNNVKIKEGD
jgi:hypothetical protein